MNSLGNVYLLGLPLCGKSTVGKILSELCGLPFEDLDQTLSLQAGKSIPDIFAQDGEPAFRDLETQILKGSTSSPSCIFATGGGVIERPGNRQFLSDYATFYLNLPLDQLLTRGRTLLTNGQAMGRPLLSGADWEARLGALYERRHPLYLAAARYTIDASTPPAQTARAIHDLLRLKEEATSV